jgi:hypothetical protein
MEYITRKLHIKHPLDHFYCLRGNMEETGWFVFTFISFYGFEGLLFRSIH